VIFETKRSELEIVEEILSLAREETKKTWLMYQTNLCYSQFVLYLNFLIEKKFLEIHNGVAYGTSTYMITEKGKQFLQSIDTVLVQVK
jgi:predicted transcriptional regulator